ncbi:spindle and kinetochore-associated protein 1 homolog isoform X2 [Rosa chinensis]|uniref:spindle and kinetochore-associated protein 1 homolog isoform X2 n=1 Tax=Rosa chinensis TaxID=74649 RepID=UPI000D08D0D2|nr:spindle and kinetochore-associated protein 1 homolog isoform X2 [Rosa chinensis]
MEAEKAGASLDSLIAGFNSRISELKELVIARNMYPASSVTDLSAVDAAVKAMELQVQAIKDRVGDETLAIPKAKKLIDASLKQQRKLKDMSVYAPTHVPERMSMLNLDTNRCLFPESSQQNTGSGTFNLDEDPAPPPPPPPPKEKKGRSTPPLWFISTEELDSLSSYMRGRLTLEKVNAAINDMATYAEANYQLIAAPKKNVAGDRWEKALEIRDIAMHEAVKGKHFFLETDMKGPSLKLDNTGKAILTDSLQIQLLTVMKLLFSVPFPASQVLRHLGRVNETRIGHHRVIILLKPH